MGIASVMQEDDEGLHPGNNQEKRYGDVYPCIMVTFLYHKPLAIAASYSGASGMVLNLRSAHNFIHIHEGDE